MPASIHSSHFACSPEPLPPPHFPPPSMPCCSRSRDDMWTLSELLMRKRQRPRGGGLTHPDCNHRLFFSTLKIRRKKKSCRETPHWIPDASPPPTTTPLIPLQVAPASCLSDPLSHYLTLSISVSRTGGEINNHKLIILPWKEAGGSWGDLEILRKLRVFKTWEFWNSQIFLRLFRCSNIHFVTLCLEQTLLCQTLGVSI